jgi:hypothetical protein
VQQVNTSQSSGGDGSDVFSPATSQSSGARMDNSLFTSSNSLSVSFQSDQTHEANEAVPTSVLDQSDQSDANKNLSREFAAL